MLELPYYKAKQVSVDRKRHYEIEGHCYPGYHLNLVSD